MGVFTKTAIDILAPLNASGEARSVENAEVQVWGTEIERTVSSFISNGGLIYASLADLNADLAHAQNFSAWVIGDAVTENNGIYQKSGASGGGYRTHIVDLPFSFIVAVDSGTGTPNAIQATRAFPTSGSSLIVVNVSEANDGSPVTIFFQ